MNVVREVGKRAVLEHAQLVIKLMTRKAGAMTHQIMHTAVNEPAVALPRFRHAARLGVMLDDERAVAIHPRVAARRESRESRADDDDGFFCQTLNWEVAAYFDSGGVVRFRLNKKMPTSAARLEKNILKPVMDLSHFTK